MFNIMKLIIWNFGGLIAVLVSFFVTLKVLDDWDKFPTRQRSSKA